MKTTLSSLDFQTVDPVLEGDIISMLEKHEGIRAWMYLDLASPPNVTAGIGHAIFRSQDAILLPFRRMSDSKPASAAEIVACWSKLKYQTAIAANRKTEDKSLYLFENDIEALAMNDLSRFEPLMDKTFPAFWSYPQQAQCAMYDMIWQVGSFSKWPHFVTAVKGRNWEEAARQCYRPQASKSRNDDTRALFVEAANSSLDFS